MELRTFGSVEASASVAVRPQTGGLLIEAAVKDGQDVRAGDVLFRIDDRPAKAALAQAEAEVARSTVQSRNAALEAERQEKLWQKGLTAQDLRDQARTQADALAAAVRGSEAAVTNARIQMDYCEIRSPIDGRAGRIQVDAGNVVKADETTLVTVNRIHPVYVAFAAPQADLGRIRERMAAGALQVTASIPDQPGRVETGTLSFADNAVDKETGTIRLHGTFSNELSRLWPGQFVNVVLTYGVESNALVVPSAAVQSGQKGSYVFVVGSDETAAIRPVVAARKAGEETVVSSGLRPGEQVVIDGQYKLKPGGRVRLESKSTGAAGRP